MLSTGKSLGDRVAYEKSAKPSSSTPLTKTSPNPKAQPKSATAIKTNANATSKKAANKAKKQAKSSTRSKPKTAEELDADMTDYYINNNNGGGTIMTDANSATNGNAQPAAAGGEDLGMDEISVSSSVEFIT